MRDYGNELVEQYKERLKEKAKKKIKNWLIGLLLAFAPLIVVIFVVVMAGAGALQVFSVFGDIAKALFGDNDMETRIVYEGEINDIELDDLIALVENNQLDQSFYKNLMFSRTEFLHMLKKVKLVNEDYAEKTISIGVRHTYQEWVEDDVYAANPAAADGHYETKTEYLTRDVHVDSRDIEKYKVDWQMVYTMCIANVVNTDRDWMVETDEEGNEDVRHYGENFDQIDAAVESARMKYDYITDLARASQTSYSMDECKAMIHTPYLYGDPDTEEGEWEYYVPHSVLRSASSAYSTIFYNSSTVEDPDTGEVTTYLNKISEASFMSLYDLTMRRYTYNYDFEYTCDLMSLTPGGNKISEKLRTCRAYEESIGLNEDGSSKPGVIFWSSDLSLYKIPDGYTLDDFPTSTKIVNSSDGNIDYSGIEFDEGRAGSFVMAALQKVGCQYSQKRRNEEGYYDCSSFVTRIAAEVGITITGGTAAGICQNMVEAGRAIDPSDIQQGDIIFYARKDKFGNWKQKDRYMHVSHVSIYVGDGKQVHAINEAKGVDVTKYTGSDVVVICRPNY